MVIDRQRLARNCERLVRGLAAGRHFRIVAKSLPSVPLIREIMTHTGTRRVMAFHQPFINALAEQLPECDILLGKPMPVQTARQFYATLSPATSFRPETQLQWLIDSEVRLQQYLSLAQDIGRRLRVNIEIDVGLHRGGLQDIEQLDPLLEVIAANPSHLEFAGFMGYDAHVGKLPPLVERSEVTLKKSQAAYGTFIDRLQNRFPQLCNDTLTFNGAGSPTIFLHGDDTPMNELAAGSCLLKPLDFELESLAEFEPAAFIATPVLKSLPELELPGPVPVGRLWSAWDMNRRHTWFIYGGNWLARPVAPAGLQENPIYGTSSNQMMLNGSATQRLEVDDFVFFRPLQSEGVLLQFGDLAACDSESFTWWPTLEAGRGRSSPA